MNLQQQNSSMKFLFLLFFLNAVVEINAEIFVFKPILYFSKPLIPIILLVMYYITSKVKSILFILVLFFSAITNLLFIPNTEKFLLYAIIVFTIHRVLMLAYIYKNVIFLSYRYLFIATLPIIAVFYYLFIESNNAPKESHPILLFQIILISVLVGIAFSNYIKNDSLQNTLLMISALLFACLQLVIYIEKYFLTADDYTLLRPIAMALNVMAFFSFYKFVLVTEESKLQI